MDKIVLAVLAEYSDMPSDMVRCQPTYSMHYRSFTGKNLL